MELSTEPAAWKRITSLDIIVHYQHKCLVSRAHSVLSCCRNGLRDHRILLQRVHSTQPFQQHNPHIASLVFVTMEKPSTNSKVDASGPGGVIVRWLEQSPWRPRAVLLLVVLLVVLAATVGHAFSFSGHTSNNFSKPSKHVEAYTAYQTLSAQFPLFPVQDTELIVVSRKDGGVLQPSVTNGELANFCHHQLELPLRGLQAYSTLVPTPLIETPFTYTGPLAVLGLRLISERSALVVIRNLNSSDPATATFVTQARGIVTALPSSTSSSSSAPQFQAIMTGRITLQQIAQQKTGIGFAISDGSGIVPIVFIFWYMVGSWRLMLVPALAVASALIASYAIGGALITHAGVSVPSYEPDIMLFLSLGLSIDYR